jgi:anthranilate phosphoribosyltransferase
MQHLITKIGKGQRGVRDLTWDEGKEAIRLMMEGQATGYQMGAFLMAMRIKLEAVPELAAFTAATRSYVAPLSMPGEMNVVDVPAYGEKHNTIHICLGAAILATAAGAKICLHSIEHPTASSDLSRILAELKIPNNLQGQDLTTTIKGLGFAYLDLALYHPPLVRFLELREELGAQNLFHQVARLLNPTRAQSQVIGVAHPPYLEKIPEAVAMLGGHRLLVFQGVEGFPELSISTPALMRELRDDRIVPVHLKPQDVRLPLGSFQHMAVPQPSSAISLPTQEALIIAKILHNEITDRLRDWTIYNAALLLYAAGQAPSIATGVSLAERTLESGAAAKKLKELSTVATSPHATAPDKKVVHA